MSGRDLSAAGERDRATGELEALLFAAARPWSVGRIARRLYIRDEEALGLLEQLGEHLLAASRGLHLRRAGDGWQLETKPEYEDVVAGARVERRERPLSEQAQEVLTVVILKQPVTTGDISATRRAESYAAIANLRERGLLVGVSMDDGKALRWRVTQKLLDLCSARSAEELRERMRAGLSVQGLLDSDG